MVRSSKIRILAVDQNPLLREGLAILIRLQPDMELVGMVESYEEAVYGFALKRPDVTLMDLDLPSGTGLTAIREILKITPDTCIIGTSTYEWNESCTQAIRAGARSCIPKDRLNQDLVPLVRDCVRRSD